MALEASQLKERPWFACNVCIQDLLGRGMCVMNNKLWHSQFLHPCHCSVISPVTNLIKLGSLHILFRLVCLLCEPWGSMHCPGLGG